MEINWFTVIAQILNFLILVWLLKRFLYQPVLDAIDQREKKIAAQIQEAASQKAQAEEEHVLYQKKNQLFDQERSVKMNEALEETKIEKQRLFNEAKKESDILKSKLEEAIRQQIQDVLADFQVKATHEVFAIAEKILSDLANSNLEEKMVENFIRKIHEMNEEEKIKFKLALNTENEPLTIHSAFDLSDSSKRMLESVLEEVKGQKIQFQYLTQPELISGIEVTADNYQLSWNIDSYLESLKKNLLPKKQEHAS